MTAETKRTKGIKKLPPLPPGDYARPGGKRDATIPYWNAPAGYCRWCGEDLGKRLPSGEPDPRLRWHAKCVEARFSYTPGVQRRRIWNRELGVCQGCGRFCPWHKVARSEHWFDEDPGAARHLRSLTMRGRRTPAWVYFRRWAVDHIVPLWAGGANEDENLQLLCEPCHKVKTAREATQRAAARRIDDEPATQAEPLFDVAASA